MNRAGMQEMRLGTVLLLIAMLIPSHACAQRDRDTRLNTDSPGASSSLGSNIVALGDCVYVAWTDGRNGTSDVYFTCSIDGGATWLASEIQLNTNPLGAAGGPEIAASGDCVYVVWTDARNGANDIYFNQSLDKGETWLTSDIRLDTNLPGATSSLRPKIAVSGDSVYVTWEDSRFLSISDIHFNRSLDRGVTWLASDIRLDTDPIASSRSSVPQIAADGDAVYVTWADSRVDNLEPDIYFNRSLDGGSTWLSSDIRLDTDPPGKGRSMSPKIAASGDSVYVVWDDFRNGRVGAHLNRSTDNGATWLPTDRRVNVGAGSLVVGPSSQITVSGSSVYVTWTDRRNDWYEIYFNRSMDGGVTWLTSDLLLNTNPPRTDFSKEPQIAASGDSVYVTWRDSRLSAHYTITDIYFNRSLDNGATWLTSDIRLNTDEPGSHQSREQHIVASGSSVYVTWTDERNGLHDVYFNIPFGAQPYGAGTKGSGDITPRLDATDNTHIGDSFTITITGGLGGAFGLLGVAGPDSKATIPSVGGGQVLISPVGFVVPILLDGATDVAGAGSFAFSCQVPMDSAFLGFNLNFQAALIDPGARDGITLTNGVEAWIL